MNEDQLEILLALASNSLKETFAIADHYGFNSQSIVSKYERIFKVTRVPTLDDHILAKHFAHTDAVEYLAKKIIELEG